MRSSDLWFIAFLLHKNHQIKSYTVVSKGKISCEFDISREAWQNLKLEFNNSDISSYKATIEKIKDLAY